MARWIRAVVLLFFLVAVVVSSPLIDISSTSLGIAEYRSSPHTSTISVTVKRLDDLLTDNGEFLGERRVSVQVNLEVSDSKILVNGEPIPMGPSSVILKNVLIVPADRSIEAVSKAFPIGLVKMELFAEVERIESPDQSVSFRRILLAERIVEIEGHVVIETDTTQQIIDLLDDGRVFHYDASDPLAHLYPPVSVPASKFGEVSAPPNAVPCGLRSAHHAAKKFGNRLMSQPVVLRVLIIGLLSSALFLILFSIPILFKIIYDRLRSTSSYDPLPPYEEVEVHVSLEEVEEKQKLMLSSSD